MKTNENKIKHIRYGRNQGPRELTVYGPEGLYDYLCSTLTYSQVPPRSNAAVKVVEIASSESANRNPKQKPHGSLVHSGIVEEGTIVETSTHVVSCARIVHRPGLDAYGFVVEEVALPRKVLVEEARRAGLTPGPLYQHLQAGQDVVLQDGTVVRADDVTQENVRPRKVVIVGDTCDASALVPLAENADIVVHEATLEDEQWILARRHGHCTAGGAGRFAAKAKAKALILTHMSSRHHSVKHLERLREQARKSFAARSRVRAGLHGRARASRGVYNLVRTIAEAPPPPLQIDATPTSSSCIAKLRRCARRSCRWGGPRTRRRLSG